MIRITLFLLFALAFGYVTVSLIGSVKMIETGCDKDSISSCGN